MQRRREKFIEGSDDDDFDNIDFDDVDNIDFDNIDFDNIDVDVEIDVNHKAKLNKETFEKRSAELEVELVSQKEQAGDSSSALAIFNVELGTQQELVFAKKQLRKPVVPVRLGGATAGTGGDAAVDVESSAYRQSVVGLLLAEADVIDVRTSTRQQARGGPSSGAPDCSDDDDDDDDDGNGLDMLLMRLRTVTAPARRRPHGSGKAARVVAAPSQSSFGSEEMGDDSGHALAAASLGFGHVVTHRAMW